MNTNAPQKARHEGRNGRYSLEAKLSRLATVADVYEGNRRVISDDASTDILSAILREIDETVLARELIFRDSSENTLTVVAVSRRLMSISKVSPKELLPEGTDILTKPLSEKDVVSISAVEELLLSFVVDIETLTVTAVRTDYSDDFANAGITIETLAACLMLD